MMIDRKMKQVVRAMGGPKISKELVSKIREKCVISQKFAKPKCES